MRTHDKRINVKKSTAHCHWVPKVSGHGIVPAPSVPPRLHELYCAYPSVVLASRAVEGRETRCAVYFSLSLATFPPSVPSRFVRRLSLALPAHNNIFSYTLTHVIKRTSEACRTGIHTCLCNVTVVFLHQQ